MNSAYQYQFVTTWKVQAPLQRVWQLIYEQDKWPLWWKGVVKVETLQEGDENSLGKKVRYTWKGILPYYLTFDMEACKVEAPFILEGIATGELEGEGSWDMHEEDGITTLLYYWNVNTTKKWMNRLFPVIKPLLKLNHDIVMRWGAKGMAKQLNATLIKY
jgi:hypothetical protein